MDLGGWNKILLQNLLEWGELAWLISRCITPTRVALVFMVSDYLDDEEEDTSLKKGIPTLFK